MLRTIVAIIEVLGGTFAASKRLGVSPSAISNWKARGIIPAERYLSVSKALKDVGKTAHPSLFGFVSKPSARAS
jgi:DNA-binding transcriptional regulator YdaS (Cro superfamily)